MKVIFDIEYYAYDEEGEEKEEMGEHSFEMKIPEESESDLRKFMKLTEGDFESFNIEEIPEEAIILPDWRKGLGLETTVSITPELVDARVAELRKKHSDMSIMENVAIQIGLDHLAAAAQVSLAKTLDESSNS